MGSQPSKDSFKESPSFGSSPSSSWDRHQGYDGHGQSSYEQNHQEYAYQGSQNNEYAYPPTYPAPQNYPPPPPQSYGRQQSYVPSTPSYAPPPINSAHHAGGARGKLDRRYSRIADNYGSLEEVTGALARAGLESSNLILGIDFTKSNEWTGSKSFRHRSLHHIGDEKNPYEQAISIIGRTLSAFDEDNLIPCYGFGDAKTHDQDVFSFYPDDRPCNGFEEALARYREIVPHLRLAGPTSFAPIIEMAMTIVEQSGGQYHVLVIIADGQVTRSVDTADGQLSQQEQKTVDAIVKASEYPLSIVLVGVGDGPWDMMKEFDDNIPARAFDNFQFVNFTDIMMKKMPVSRQETEFALTALMEIPTQYKATLELKLLGRRLGKSPQRVPLPPSVPETTPFSSKTSQFGTFPHDTAPPSYHGYETSKVTAPPSYGGYDTSMSTAPPESAVFENQVCVICLSNPKDMAFGCGHQTCRDCGKDLKLCPICRAPIETRIKLY